MQAINTIMTLRERIESLFVYVILAIILFVAIAILLSPRFAEALAILVILLVIAAFLEGLSSRK
jgi:hypothetical protein